LQGHSCTEAKALDLRLLGLCLQEQFLEAGRGFEVHGLELGLGVVQAAEGGLEAGLVLESRVEEQDLAVQLLGQAALAGGLALAAGLLAEGLDDAFEGLQLH
jgi:hypothetical protein